MTPTMTIPEANTIAMLRMHFKCSFSKIGILAKAIWSENDLATMCGVAYLGSDLGRALVNTMEGILFIDRGTSDSMHMNEIACLVCKGTQISIYPEDCPKVECIHCRAMIPALNVMLRDILKPRVKHETILKPGAIAPPAPDQFTFTVKTRQGNHDVVANLVEHNAEYVTFRLNGMPVASFARQFFVSYCRKQTEMVNVSDDRNDKAEAVPVTGISPCKSGLKTRMLEKYGIKWNGPEKPICEVMFGGYWTPWHIAQDEITTLTSQLQQSVDLLRAGKKKFSPNTTNSLVDDFLAKFDESDEDPKTFPQPQPPRPPAI